MGLIMTKPLRNRVPGRIITGAVLAISASWLHGCAGRAGPLDRSSQGVIDSAQVWRAGLIETQYRPDLPGDQALPEQPQSADDYVTLALAHNPAITSARAKIRRLEQRSPQARSLEDPMLMVAPIGEMGETAAGQVGLMTSISQRLPLPAKRDAAGRIAELEVAQATAELQQLRLQIAAEAKKTYWSYCFSSRAIATTGQSRSLLLQFRDIADAQFRSGQRNQEDVFRASAELASLDTELAMLAQQRASAAAMLRQLISVDPSQPLPDPSPAQRQDISLQRDALLARAAKGNPALLRVSERMAQFEQQQRLANLNRWPDLTLSLSYNVVDNMGLSKVANGQDQWWIGFGINLPIWAEKNDAAEREAIFGRLESAAELASERNRVLFRVEDALLRLDSQRTILSLIRTKVLPDARAAVEAAATTYRTGTGDFLVLIDNWRKLLSYQVLEHQGVAAVEQALADLQEAVGDDLDSELRAGVPSGSPHNQANREPHP